VEPALLVVTGLNDPHALGVPQLTDQVTSPLDVVFPAAAESDIVPPMDSAGGGVFVDKTEIGSVVGGGVTSGTLPLHPVNQTIMPKQIKRKAVLRKATLYLPFLALRVELVWPNPNFKSRHYVNNSLLQNFGQAKSLSSTQILPMSCDKLDELRFD
jgi:hypothetical protein